jgi:integrase
MGPEIRRGIGLARSLHKLTARGVAASSTDGRFSDGGGLYLVISDAGVRKRWVFRFTFRDKAREMGLGSSRDVTLAEAREKATAARSLVSQGKDPIHERDLQNRAAARIPSFSEMVEEVLLGLEPSFKNEKHKAQWRMTLTVHAAPLARLPVDAVTTDDVLDVLRPLWSSRPETASRLRGRIEHVLDAAMAKRFRTDANPARWRGHLKILLPQKKKLARGHHAALPFEELATFIRRLRAVDGLGARALEFTILTASRTSETLGAHWSEFDLDAAVWTVPATRMKAGRVHRVPLSDRAVAILEQLRLLRREDGLVFPGTHVGKAASSMVMAMQLRRMGVHATVHGFRSTFRDWVGDLTDFDPLIAEAALAHTVGDATERAYRRKDALSKRRALMEAWASAIEPPSSHSLAA